MVASLLTRLSVPKLQVMPSLLGRHTGQSRVQFAARFLVDLFESSRTQTESRRNKVYLGTCLLM